MDWKNNGYKLNAILAFYFSIIFILLFSAVNIIFAMLLQNPLKIFYILVPGSWLLLSVFLQIIDNFSPFKEFIKRYGKVPAEYSKTQLKNIDVDSLGSRLNSLMAVKKVYRNEKLSLQKLARMVEISPQQLSEYLNSVKKYGYREYINSFRIEEAKQLLTDKPEMNASLVGFEVGFPSVSGFYKIFKKYTGVSPADFRKKKHLALIA
ncbi:MAG: helix-turn-helix domain-containing protein [Spirochaetia bacterium]|nr:helix-turn-helix domain-containing protein [Spirochaetia bacterium]